MLGDVAFMQVLPELTSGTHAPTNPLLGAAVSRLAFRLPAAIEHREAKRVPKRRHQCKELARSLWRTLIQRRDKFIRGPVAVFGNVVKDHGGGNVHALGGRDEKISMFALTVPWMRFSIAVSG